MIPHQIDRHAENAEDRLAPVHRYKGVVAREAGRVVARARDPEGRVFADLDGSRHRASCEGRSTMW